MLAQQNRWNSARIERALMSGRTHGVELQNPLPVYIAYWTAWVDENGQLQFRPDIYHRDKAGNFTRALSRQVAGLTHKPRHIRSRWSKPQQAGTRRHGRACAATLST